MSTISRRIFLKVAGAAAAALPAGADPASERPGASPPSDAPKPASGQAFFTAEEASFVEAAVERLIPSDDVGPGAREAGVAAYIDRQLAGPWGAGERLYRGGPWHSGEETQGYQLRFTPAELFRHALRGAIADVQKRHERAFAKLDADAQDAYLRSIEKSDADFDGVPASSFFEALLEMAVEGFFCDPVYGGNRDMVGWKLIGFPGAYANYYPYVDRHNVAFTRPPVSLAEDARGELHVDPLRPAYMPASHGHEPKKGR